MASQLSQEAKKVILRVLEFCKEEQYNRRPIIPLKKTHLRVATATGVSLHSVANIIREAKIAALNGTKIGEAKQRKQRSDKFKFSEFDIELVKDIINDYYKEHEEWPSTSKLLPLLRKQIGFTNSKETLRKALREIGYEKEDNKCTVSWKTNPAVNVVQQTNNNHEIYHDHDYSKS